MTPGRPAPVDAHAHIVVPELLALDGAGEPWRAPAQRLDGRTVILQQGRPLASVVGEFVDVEVMLEQAATAGIRHLLLSPWVRLLADEHDLDGARTACRTQNDALAALVRRWPGRISALGAVPLQEPEEAAGMLTGLLEQGLAGVEVAASVRGAYLGDDRFRVFWAAAESAGALVFIHPTTRGLGLEVFDQYYLWNTVANPVETAVTAAHLVMSGVLERHPALRVLLAHGGGALATLRGRLRHAHGFQPAARARLTESPDDSIGRFFYDSITHDEQLLRQLVAWAGADRVLLGSDRPFDMGTAGPVEEVLALGLPAVEEAAILGGNARRLLGLEPAAPAEGGSLAR